MDAPRPLPTAADLEGLRRLARGLLGRGDLAEDAVQDAPRVRGASVRLADGSAWPLFRWDAAGARLAEGFDLPLPGARVGPYPRRHAAPTLVLERDEGEQRIPLLPDDELPAPGVPR